MYSSHIFMSKVSINDLPNTCLIYKTLKYPRLPEKTYKFTEYIHHDWYIES